MKFGNTITLVGNMGSDARIINFDNGGKIARFNLATNVRDKQGKKMAEWHKVFAWGNMATFIESHGAKGKQLAIHGRLVNRTYVDKRGDQRDYTEVEVKHVIGI